MSFFLALAVTFWVLAVPTDFAGPEGDVDHRALLALMWGLAAGYTHGVGFIPRNRILRVLLGPLAAWGLLVGGGWWFLARG
ncbi:MAG: cyd operon YbgE family protein [Thiohalorhabdus sp.]|uniref:cyd operon YbgE family protein n=1 Tax=Thiohalorhabdus sp. TaxID=3094134 RepID=UPI00398190EA